MKRVFLFLTLLMLVCASCAMAEECPVGTVLAGDDLALRVAPSADAEIITELFAGDMLIIAESSGDWYRAYTDDDWGYVHAEAVELQLIDAAQSVIRPNDGLTTIRFLTLGNRSLQLNTSRCGVEVYPSDDDFVTCQFDPETVRLYFYNGWEATQYVGFVGNADFDPTVEPVHVYVPRALYEYVGLTSLFGQGSIAEGMDCDLALTTNGTQVRVALGADFRHRLAIPSMHGTQASIAISRDNPGYTVSMTLIRSSELRLLSDGLPARDMNLTTYTASVGTGEAFIRVDFLSESTLEFCDP